jgi:hypothetical protein
MSHDVAVMLLDLLSQVQLSGADPDLGPKVALLLKAKDELTAALEGTTEGA